MSEPSWAEGYVVDVGYTHGYFREVSPVGLRFVTLLGGVQAIDTDQPFTYYELGCGNGYSSALHAAANPRGRFFGVDFNPTHIHNARSLAQETGLANVQFLEKSFAELIASDLPDAEIIVLHGVYSWVSEENRRHIVEFIRQRLKPAGMVYVSYNALPGLAQVAPLQRLLFERANLGSGPLFERLRRALEFATRLDQTGAEYFNSNPLAKARLARIGKQDPRYLAHEYFNANWSPAYHAEVAEEMAAAKLGFVGSADFLDNFKQFVVKPEMEKLLADLGDQTMAETIKDFARNRLFRKDVFTRGAPKASPAELEAMLKHARFALVRPRADCQLQRVTPVGEVTLQAEAYAPVLDALARAPLTYGELARAPETAGFDKTRLRQAVFGMAALGNVLPALPAAGEDERRTSTANFNRAVMARPVITAASTVLASPVLGAGVALGLVDRLLLGARGSQSEAADVVYKAMAASGHRPMRDDKPVESEQEIRAIIEQRAKWFFSTLLPHLRQLGVAD